MGDAVPDAHGTGELTVLVRRWLLTAGDSSEDPSGGAPPAAEAVPYARPSGTTSHRGEDGMFHDPPHRLAVLIDARTTTPDDVASLFRVLPGYGSVTICRAYGDWTELDMGPWEAQLRQHGIQPVHHFATAEHDRTLVALTVDAVDLGRRSAVDLMVMVGDLGPTLPLVNRLHTAGVRVLAVGPARTPEDLEAACDEYLDLATLSAAPWLAPGRHRASG